MPTFTQQVSTTKPSVPGFFPGDVSGHQKNFIICVAACVLSLEVVHNHYVDDIHLYVPKLIIISFQEINEQNTYLVLSVCLALCSAERRKKGIPGGKSQRWKGAGAFQEAVRAGLLGAEAGTSSMFTRGPLGKVGSRGLHSCIQQTVVQALCWKQRKCQH